MARRVVVTPQPDLSQPADMALLGAVVRHRRTSLKLTLEDAAALCGISKQAYNNIELGSENVKVETLFKVLTAFGISLRVNAPAFTDTGSDIGGASDDWL
ncbi:MAG: helix-turn-helix protein [Idiomarinaceae bacterium HL-53]|nr:MAG: helix-turn-helix protein [Idiomarinaceae bacterium HL-53]CUS48001.1 Helix-turn-helix [Idiomarinaceae bacterium HL-53]